MNESDVILKEYLTHLKAEYNSQLDYRFKEISELWSSFRNRPCNSEEIGVLYRELQYLVSSGTPLGIKQIAETAHLLEIFLSSLLKTDSGVTERYRQQIDLLLQLLSSMISEDYRPNPNRKQLRWEPAGFTPNIGEDRPLVYIFVNNELNLSEVKKNIEYSGYSVEVFNFFYSFNEAIQNRCPAVVIISTDLQDNIYDKSGSIKNEFIVNNRDIPVIYISQKDDLTNRLYAIRSGFNCYLSLPVDVSKLKNKVDELAMGVPRDPYRVLIIDDDIVMSDFYTYILEHEGMNVKVINNPLETLGAIHANKPELILLNVDMPECSGLELARIIRQYEEYAGISILYLSDNNDYEHRLLAIKSGGDDLINIPVNPDNLIATINSRVSRARTLNTMNLNFESALREIENQHFALDQHAIVSITNVNGTIVYVNNKFCDITGYTRSELIGKDHTILKSGIHPDRVYAEMWQSINRGHVWKGEICNRKKNGDYYWVEITIVPFMDVKNRPYQYVAINTDISSRIFAEKDLLKARDMAINANQAKSEFLSKISHEIRTPLNAIMGFSQLLELSNETKLTKTQSQYLNEIHNAGEHLLKLINEVLDLSRIEANQLNIENINIPLEPFLDECCSLVIPMTGKNNISIIKKYEHGNLVAYADPLRLKQILLNLLSNAIKYNRYSGSVTLRTSCTSEGMIIIDIIDTGEGIPENQINQLFQPFYRLPHHRQEEGVGIGLTLSKRLVELMDGKISVESKFGKGTRFRIEINSAENDQKLKINTRDNADLNLITNEADCKILYIEDNLANYNLIKEALLQRPYFTLTHAHSAETGIGLVEKDHPDIILMDLQLPGINGYEAFKQLKNNPALSKIPVIAISADLTPANVERANKMGFHSYLTKPINILNFLATLDSIVEGLP